MWRLTSLLVLIACSMDLITVLSGGSLGRGQQLITLGAAAVMTARHWRARSLLERQRAALSGIRQALLQRLPPG